LFPGIAPPYGNYTHYLLDEWIDGKFLPKGTICFINVWGLHHDEGKFPNHDVFDPEHYKGKTLLANEYANSADYENRDHYGYGMFLTVAPFLDIARGAGVWEL
jgi:cytochrome P450 family 619